MKSDTKIDFKLSDWDIVGHENQIEYLKSSVLKNDIAHSYLFSGEEKIGKKRIALTFIKSLMCLSDLRHCNKCISCQQIDKLIHPDVAFISSTGSIKIEAIRGIISKTNLKPFNAPYKVAIINNAENLTNEAANAFLKTLEEPPGQSVIILITKDHSLLLPTIISRLRMIRFFRVPTKDLEKLINGDKDKDLLLKIASGKTGKIFDLINDPTKIIKYENWLEQLDEILSGDKVKNLEYSTQIAKIYDSDPEEVIEMLRFWILIFRDFLDFKHKEPLFFKQNNLNFMETLNTEVIIDIIRYIGYIENKISNINSGINSKLALDLVILKIGKIKKL